MRFWLILSEKEQYLTEGIGAFLYNRPDMAQILEKRGPIEKGPKGWPINPFGAAAIAVFILIIALLILIPIVSQKLKKAPFVNGKLSAPQAGELVKSKTLPIKLDLDNPSKVAKVQFWAKTYAENKWEIIGEDSDSPFELEWQIPESYRNKSVAITANVFLRNGQVVKDPGGWREGIIILNQ